MPLTLKTNGIKLKNGNEYSSIDAFYIGDIESWMDEHPEATTTVQDESLTYKKLVKGTLGYADPKMFGAVGDGVTDDTTAMNNCVLFCNTNNLPLVINEDSTIYIPENTTFIGLKQIQIKGTIKAPNGVEFRFNSNQVGCDWSFNNVIGSLTLSGLKASLIKVINVTELIIFADSTIANVGSVAYNQFILGYVPTLTIKGANSGWINENFFYGGRILNLTFANGGNYAHNHNHFYNNSFEGASINFYCGRSNYIHNARLENVQAINFYQKATNNYVHVSYRGETIPEYKGLLSAWNDTNGTNYLYYGITPAVKQYEKIYTSYSLNYNANQLYPLNGKLHNVSFSNNIITTNKINIEHALGIKIESDKSFFRGSIKIYDANGDQIMTQPPYSPIYGTTLSWDSNGYYTLGSTNRNILGISLSKHTITGGHDTGVSYASINLTGYAGIDIDYLKCVITAPWYSNITPFKPDKLTATSKPTAGDWEDGVIAYNTDPTKNCLGWFYNNDAWHEIGTYTTT